MKLVEHSRLVLILSAVLALGLMACSSMKISSKTAPGAEFGGYSSFHVASSQSIDDPRIEDLTALIIIRELEAKGYTRSGPDADLIVTFDGHVGSREQMATRLGYAVETWQGETTVYTVSRGVPMGQLLINAIDRTQGSVVWSAEVQTGLKPELEPTKRLQRLEKAVVDMMARFPGTR